MNQQPHILESLAMDLAGGSLRISGNCYPVAKVTFDPGNRLANDRPALLVRLHSPLELEAVPCGKEKEVRDYSAPAAAPSPAKQDGTGGLASKLMTEGSGGGFILRQLHICDDKGWMATVLHGKAPLGAVASGRTPADAVANALTGLSELFS